LGAKCTFISAIEIASLCSSVLSYGNMGGYFFAAEDLFIAVVLAAGAAVIFLFCRVFLGGRGDGVS
jgi:arylamine N-acetyltransferase